MSVALHPPRLLPLTIAVGAMLMASKSILLLHAALPGAPPLPANGDVLSSARAATAPGPGPNGRLADAAGDAPSGTQTGASSPRAAPTPGGRPGADARASDVQTPPAPPPPAAASAPIRAAAVPEITEGERAVLLDLRKRRAELEAREQRDTEREAMLEAAEKRLAERVHELQSLQSRLEALEAQRASREDTGWRGLVRMYEAMRPRDAASIFNDLDMAVLLPVLDRMNERKAAPVLAAMQPDKARLATTQLAALREKENTPAAPAAPGGAPATASSGTPGGMPAAAATPPAARGS